MFGTLILTAAMLQTEGTIRRSDGLNTVEFKQNQGTVRLYLPEDVRAGDTVSGTVIALPEGSGSTRVSNQGMLEGMVIEIDGRPSKVASGTVLCTLAGLRAGPVLVRLISEGGTPLGSAHVPTVQAPAEPLPWYADPVCVVGRPMTIQGSFDGDASNTTVSLGGQPGGVLAESPRSCSLVPATPSVGPCEIRVGESGGNHALQTHFASMKLTAGKTKLLQGEKTTLRMEVSGLAGLPRDAYPIPYEIENLTPEIVDMSGAKGNRVAAGANFQDVKNGVFATSLTLTGLGSGQFLIRGGFFAVSIHSAKKMMGVASFNQWVAGLIEAYKAKIAELEKALKEDRDAGRKNPGLELNIARKRNILNVLIGFSNATNNDIGVAKIAVDKALADDSFFALAAELISIAADMLGYTEIPMPGIGTVLKGAKALVSNLPKVIKAIEAAEKLVEAYEKLSDAKEKLDKAKEIKDALDKVKSVIDDED